jgi:hypothetical protein
MCSGAISGTIYSAVMCPFELVKVNAQKAQVLYYYRMCSLTIECVLLL